MSGGRAGYSKTFAWSQDAEDHPNVLDYRHWQPECERPDGLVAPVRVDTTGLHGPTRNQARGSRWRQTSPGLYVPTTVDPSLVEQRILEQGHRVKKHGAVGGWSALRWYGATYFDGTDRRGGTLPVFLVTCGSNLRPDSRVQLDYSTLAQTERVEVAGLRCTTIQRALFDFMRHARNVREAVVAMDMTAAARLISVYLMDLYVEQRAAWTGVPMVRTALALASNDSRSPMETLMRLIWILDAMLEPPVCNQPLFSTSGVLLGYPDLLDVESGTLGEYDGVDHKDRDRHRADVEREARYRDHGLEYFTVVGGDIGERDKVVRRMHAARSRARFAKPENRQWTLTPPSWWIPREEPLDVHLARLGTAPLLLRT